MKGFKGNTSTYARRDLLEHVPERERLVFPSFERRGVDDGGLLDFPPVFLFLGLGSPLSWISGFLDFPSVQRGLHPLESRAPSPYINGFVGMQVTSK